MTHIQVEGSTLEQSVDVTTHPEFKKNRAMLERAVRMIGDASLPQVVRDAAKAEGVHYAMKNIRQFGPDSEDEGQKLLDKGSTEDHLLLEASYPDEDTQTPEHIRELLSAVETGHLHDPVDDEQELTTT